MADSYLGLADITKLNDENLSGLDVDDLLIDAPLLAAMAAVPASNGDIHKYLRTDGAPAVGFRSVNDGREHDNSTKTVVTETLKLLDASFTIDTAIGSLLDGGMPSINAMELAMHLRSAFSKAETQLIYGTIVDANGFTGLGNIRSTVSDAYVIDAGATTALSSVWLLRSRPDELAMVAAHDGRIDVGEPQEQRIDGATGHYMAWATRVHGWYALQQGSTIANCVRIANLGATANMVDDDLIYQAISLFPSARQPNVIAMNRRSLEQLRKSRTATNATGSPAPTPTEVANIPIILTDTISNSETQAV